MNRTRAVFGIGVVLVLAVSALWQFGGRTTTLPSVVAPESPTTELTTPTLPDITNVSIAPASSPVQTSFAIAEGDTIVSWDFKSAYMDNPELITKARDEINRLSGLLATATSSAMILSVGIANQYELLGDGKKQYDYLGRAVQAAPTNGLPWHNLGVLMERLGAFQTARMAYERSTIVQPEFPLYHYAYLEFLIRNMKNNTVGIEKAFAAAERNIGKRQYLVDLRAEWQVS